MLDRRQAMARNHLRFSGPSCHVNSKYGSAGDSEFDFWGAKNLHRNQFEDDEPKCHADDAGEFGACSSPALWKSRNSTEYELSPLLPEGYWNRNLSTRTRSEAIAEGRRELMEMIHNMPECNYELSLKDMVDEVKTSQGVKEELMVIDKRSFGFETEDQMKKQKKTKESGGISRARGKENEIFLIKMFFPSALGLKKKPTGKKCSRVSPRTSFERSANHHHHDKEQWIKKMSVEGGNHEDCGKNSNTSRKVEVNSNSSPGCWPIFHIKKSKSKSKSRGCIF